MSINRTAVLAQVKSAIDEYGYQVQVFRDIYETDAIGCSVLTQAYVYVNDLQCLIDNYSGGRQKSITNTDRGILLNSSSATLYAAYDEDIDLQLNDWIEIDGIKYKVTQMSDTLHYHLLWTIQLERIDIDG